MASAVLGGVRLVSQMPMFRRVWTLLGSMASTLRPSSMARVMSPRVISRRSPCRSATSVLLGSRSSALVYQGIASAKLAGVVIQVAQLDHRRRVLGVRLGGMPPACLTCGGVQRWPGPMSPPGCRSRARRLSQAAAARPARPPRPRQRQPQTDQDVWPDGPACLPVAAPHAGRSVCACLPCSSIRVHLRMRCVCVSRCRRPAGTRERLSLVSGESRAGAGCWSPR